MVHYLKASAAAAVVVVLIPAVWFASDIFLMAFAGLILATLLRSAATLLSRTLHVRSGIALVLAFSILVLLIPSFVGLAFRACRTSMLSYGLSCPGLGTTWSSWQTTTTYWATC